MQLCSAEAFVQCTLRGSINMGIHPFCKCREFLMAGDTAVYKSDCIVTVVKKDVTMHGEESQHD